MYRLISEKKSKGTRAKVAAAQGQMAEVKPPRILQAQSNSFKKAYQDIARNYKNFSDDKFKEVVNSLLNRTDAESLHQMQNHKVSKNSPADTLGGRRLIHIYPNIVLVYEFIKDDTILVLHDIGRHNKLNLTN